MEARRSSAYYRAILRLLTIRRVLCLACEFSCRSPDTVPKATRRTASARQLPVACFYCDERFRRTQERATHIRHHHPGKAYRPDLEEAREQQPAVTRVLCDPAPTVAPDAGTPATDALTSKQHLVAAITAIKHRQQTIDKQVPELEKQLESLRAIQKQIDTERQALETALATIDGASPEQVQSPDALPKAGD